MKTAEEFWACVNKDGPIHPTLNTKCWLWTRAVFKQGYGQVRFVGNAGRQAHRIAWFLTTNTPMSNGQCVLHRCDVRRCVNPEHLFLGTTQDNTEDMRVKGRAAKGSRNFQARKTHCPNGHQYTSETIYKTPTKPWRSCKLCSFIRSKQCKSLHPRATKLSELEVRAILIGIAQGKSQRALAHEFSCARNTIREIVTGKTWKQIPRSLP